MLAEGDATGTWSFSIMKKVCVLFLTLLASTCTASHATAQQSDAGLRAGAAKVSIVPPHPTQIGGYFDRLENFTGVETPVYARALVFANGDTQLAVVALDLIAVSRALVDSARAEVERTTGMPAANVLISATHDHSAPSGFRGVSFLGEDAADQALYDFLVASIASAVQQAHAALRPAQVGFAYGKLDTITRNRQQGNTTVIDPDVGVLKVQEAGTRTTIGTLCNFTGHPVILGSSNLKLSSEYPGHAADVVDQVLGGVTVFTQGACGDITMQRNGDPLDEIRRLGNLIAGEIIKTSEGTVAGEDMALVSRFQDTPVEPRRLPPPDEAQAKVERLQQQVEAAAGDEKKLQQAERALDSAQTTLRIAQHVAGDPQAVEAVRRGSVHVMQIGPLVLVGIPGELFVEYGLEMKQRTLQATGRPMILVGYANDYLGYIVTPRAIATGGYEQSISRVDVSAGRTLTEAAMAVVGDLIAPIPK
jgi:neutral ceramidase